jgi:hypothetical protein
MRLRARLVIAATAMLLNMQAMAAFDMAGFDMQVVAGQKGLVNCAASFQTNPLWILATPQKPYSFSTGFSLPQTEEIIFSRLYFNVWGGTNEYTCEVEVNINGVALDLVNIGGTADTNAVYEPNQICVYGTGFGAWQIAYNDVEALLYTDGSENVVDVTISDESGSFDGRTIDATLVSVYKDPSADYAIDFYLAEADSYLRRSPGTPGAPATRDFDISGVETADLLDATYTTLYTHGTKDQYDRLYFNGVQLGGDDVAIGAGGVYGPDTVSFNVADLLETDSNILYTVDESITGSPSEFSMSVKVGLLEVRRAYCLQAPAGDVNGDCRVDMADFAAMASNWLACDLVPQSSCTD